MHQQYTRINIIIQAVEQEIRREKISSSQIDCDIYKRRRKSTFHWTFFYTLAFSCASYTQQAKAHASLRLDFISLECRHRDLAKACDSTFVCHHHLLRVWFAFFPSLSSSVYPVNIFYCYCLRTSSKRCLILVLVRFINPRMNKKSEKKDKRVRAKRRSAMSQVSSGTNWHIFSSCPGRSRSVASTKSIFFERKSIATTHKAWVKEHTQILLLSSHRICNLSYLSSSDWLSLALAQPFIKNTLDCCGFCFPSVRLAFYTPL